MGHVPPENVADGNVNEVEVPAKQLGLRALARALRPNKNEFIQVHFPCIVSWNLRGNDLSRLSLAFKSFFGLLFRGKLPDDVQIALNLTRRAAAPAAPAAPPKPPAQPADGAVQILGVLQKEGRLIDFLMEDISQFSDDQVGAAVRDIHKNSRAALDRHLKLVPVIDGVEGALTRLAASGLGPKDTASLRLVGKVPADGKVEAGILQHRGYKVEKIDLPALKPGEKVTILAPAEIEVE
jgi:hypothetical protein